MNRALSSGFEAIIVAVSGGLAGVGAGAFVRANSPGNQDAPEFNPPFSWGKTITFSVSPIHQQLIDRVDTALTLGSMDSVENEQFVVVFPLSD